MKKKSNNLNLENFYKSKIIKYYDQGKTLPNTLTFAWETGKLIMNPNPFQVINYMEKYLLSEEAKSTTQLIKKYLDEFDFYISVLNLLENPSIEESINLANNITKASSVKPIVEDVVNSELVKSTSNYFMENEYIKKAVNISQYTLTSTKTILNETLFTVTDLTKQGLKYSQKMLVEKTKNIISNSIINNNKNLEENKRMLM